MLKKVNKKDVQPAVSALHLTLQWKREVKRIVESKMKKLSAEFMNSFLNHPITREIMEGPEGSNISGTLSGYSNLFGFIGFYEDDKPIEPLKELFKEYSIRVYSRRGKTTVHIEIPKAQDAFAITPMPWSSGRSWARGIEVGIAGFGKYLAADSTASRSGEGIQTRHNIHSGKFTRTSYISSLLRKYKENVEKLKNEFL